MPCIPRLKDSGTSPLNDKVKLGELPGHIRSAGLAPAHPHIVSAAALAACRRGMAWSRRCRAYISVGGVLTTVGIRQAILRCAWPRSIQGHFGAAPLVPAVEVVQ